MVQTILPMLDDERRVIFEPEAIIATRERRLHSRTLKETHHGRQNSFVNNLYIYPYFEDKAF